MDPGTPPVGAAWVFVADARTTGMSRECEYTHDVSAERFEDVSGEQ
jgi:hypothetical protein